MNAFAFLLSITFLSLSLLIEAKDQIKLSISGINKKASKSTKQKSKRHAPILQSLKDPFLNGKNIFEEKELSRQPSNLRRAPINIENKIDLPPWSPDGEPEYVRKLYRELNRNAE